MKGLSNILTQIENETAEKVNEVIGAANEQANKIKAESKAKAEKEAKAIISAAEVKAKDMLSRSESANELKIKRAILTKKQELINETIDKAMESIINLPDDKYFDMIIKLVKKYAHSESGGEILMSERDKKRMPKDFELNIKENYGIEVSEKTINSDGGFILSYGDIEENCTFKAVFESKREEILTLINNLLFE